MYSTKDKSLITIIVPVYNEESTIDIFIKTLLDIIKSISYEFEIIFVDDGSSDSTPDVLMNISFLNLKVITLSRNFGKEAALSAGLDHATGDAVIPVDVDLQDPLELISDFVDKWEEGYEVVYGVRKNRDSDSYVKKITSGFFYKIFNYISENKIPPNTGDYRLMDRCVVDALKLLPERNRFMKGMFSWVGFKSTGIEFSRQCRSSGESKWSYWKLWNYSISAITGFSTLPLRIWLYLGGMTLLGTAIYSSYLVFSVYSSGVDVPGYTSTLVLIMFFGGMQLFVLGIYGEYIGRIYLEVKERPVYLISNVFHNKSTALNKDK